MTTGFSDRQLRMLAIPLDEAKIQRREQDGRTLLYIEGWHAVAEANAIFGYDGWDRQTLHLEKLFERTRGDSTCCAYAARVRITVCARDRLIVREGTGVGQATANSGDAHELAMKASETDATKRALSTFGGRFGLTLYNKEQQSAAQKPLQTAKPEECADARVQKAACSDGDAGTLGAFTLTTTGGEAWRLGSPEAFCSGLRQMIEATTGLEDLKSLRRVNLGGLENLRGLPNLVTARGEHFAEVLERLIARREQRLVAGLPTPAQGDGHLQSDGGAGERRCGGDLQTAGFTPDQMAGSGASGCSYDDVKPLSAGSEEEVGQADVSEKAAIAEDVGQMAVPQATDSSPRESMRTEENALATTASESTVRQGGSPPVPPHCETDACSVGEVPGGPPPQISDEPSAPSEPPREPANIPEPRKGQGARARTGRDQGRKEPNERANSEVLAEGKNSSGDEARHANGKASASYKPTRRSRITGGFSVDKSVLRIPSERRLRSKAHLVNVANKPCAVCESQPCHAHHLTFAQPRGLSLKVSDEYTVPLCVKHHNEVHAFGAEAGWWRRQGIDAVNLARELWASTATDEADPNKQVG